jgi:tetratricopeptide (TPR) repeat protein
VVKRCNFLFALLVSAAAQAQPADSLLNRYAAYPDDSGKVNLLYEQSFAFRNSDLPAAIAFAKACQASAVKLNDKQYLAKALNLCGVLKAETGLNREALADLGQALTLRVQTRDTLSQAILLNNIGNVQAALGNSEAALASYESALRLASAVKSERWMHGALFSIADVQRTCGRYRQAEGNLYTLISWAENNYDYELQGLCYQLMGACKLALGDTAASSSYYTQAMDVALLTGDDILRADVLCSAGGLDLAKKDYAGAFAKLSEALRLCEKNRYADGLQETWKKLSEYYSASGAHREAYAYLLRHDSALAAGKAQSGVFAGSWTTVTSDSAPVAAQAFSFTGNLFVLLVLAAAALLLAVVALNRRNEQET